MRLVMSLVALVLATLSIPSRATDHSDLWWNPTESGWGVNVSQQGRALFMTFFVYSPSGQPTWVVGPDVEFQFTNASGGNVYSGALYQTTGPWFGTVFNPNAVNAVPVGTVTFTVQTVTSATLSYSISGTSVTKSIVRQTFQSNPSVNGNYIGGLVADVTSCPLASNNGHFEDSALISVSGTIASSRVQFQSSSGVALCTITGPYGQDGRMGNVVGAISCSNGNSGNIALFEIEANYSGFTGRYQAAYVNGCSEVGHYGGVRR